MVLLMLMLLKVIVSRFLPQCWSINNAVKSEQPSVVRLLIKKVIICEIKPCYFEVLFNKIK